MFVKSITDNFETVTDYYNGNIHKLDFTNWMLMYLNDNSSESDLLLSTNKDMIDPVFISWNSKCVVSGTAQFVDARRAVMPLSNFEAEDDMTNFASLYIPMSIRLGNWTAQWAPTHTDKVSDYGKKPT